jgi:hypothetical protein
MLWADGSWSTRFQGPGPVAKLLVLPFLLDPLELGTCSVPEFLHFVAGLFLDNLRRTRVAVYGRSRL